MTDDVFRQDGYRLRLEWGENGVAALGADCAVLVIVDVLSFTTAVDIALDRGGRVLPVRRGDVRAISSARAAGAVVAGEQRWTLRPSSLIDLPADTLLALPSPNGATLCAQAAATGATVFAACLRNAESVAREVEKVADGRPIGIVPAGERWGVTAGPLRPGIEDLLGAGAVAAALLGTATSKSTKSSSSSNSRTSTNFRPSTNVGGASPEARLAANCYVNEIENVVELLRGCASGRELTAAGHAADVELAAAVGTSSCAPVLRDGVLTNRLSP
ncbi:2-phosphosulfolactate phosphatase [Kutzneria buriramensis]|uniref:Probable 2-phosphosulfolactate phosphatase n=1 Tax=Kutzneria buriramensis TaxID=1045776 RepID=A0A3E0HDP7_9PSEU|nr:2-phosphosulfolactate phosphatase [Kutzneria buriramensis]REH42772.1 2-phosphosulfolactate phosphatase [Kutzneria buriramensis]